LPVNFCSHVRGSRSEEEELLQTPGGSKLLLTHAGSKKIVPEKLNQGLFFGANARILARLVPNLTPELAIYLDYLRQIGDLLVHNTSSSVYCLDHKHRYEVAEFGLPWNEINPTLLSNWLKKKDVTTTPPNSAASSRSQPRTANFAKPFNYRTQTWCWQYNQPEGCAFAPNCRFPHKCSVEGCFGDHPAFKHNFRGPSKSVQNQPQQPPGVAVYNSNYPPPTGQSSVQK
jgi:hypothetical protein